MRLFFCKFSDHGLASSFLIGKRVFYKIFLKLTVHYNNSTTVVIKTTDCVKKYNLYFKVHLLHLLSGITHYNPTGFRKAKIVYNFGLSECNTVEKL